MGFYHDHILTVVLFTPLVGALLLLFVPRDSENAHRVIGNLFAFLGLLVSLPLIWRFSLSPDAPRFQFYENHDWIPSIGAHYTLGIDGISRTSLVRQHGHANQGMRAERARLPSDSRTLV